MNGGWEKMEMNKMLKGALAGVVLYVSAGYNMDQTKLIQHDNDIPRDVPSEYKNFKFDEEIPNPRGPCFAWCGSTGPVPPMPINDYDGLTAKNILGTENIKPVIDAIMRGATACTPIVDGPPHRCKLCGGGFPIGPKIDDIIGPKALAGVTTGNYRPANIESKISLG